MKTETKHTPGWTPKPYHQTPIYYPVIAAPREDSVKECQILDDNGIWIGDCDITHAPTIIEAINAHHDLLAQRDELLAALEGLFEHCAMLHKHWGDGCNSRQADAAQAAGRAAIAHAGGKEDAR